MHYRLYLAILFSFFLFAGSLFSQNTPPNREFRAAWIATAYNIDWPSKAGLSSSEQQEELSQLISSLAGHNLNALIFQVRPAADAFYPSASEPWSQWLSGVAGKEPQPYYDPLALAIEEAHRYGMEFHAWFNPFRADLGWDSTKLLASNHVASRHPNWCISYGSNLYLDPGLPAVRTHVVQRILEVARRYDIDAVHLDDYFYPYQIAGIPFPDDESFLKYGSPMADRGDWRRDNINQFIHELRDSLLIETPHIQLGISPFGVWRNDRDDPRGSPTRAGQTSYDGLFADVRYWLERGWIDYVMPQLYFSIGYDPAAFDRLLDWWKNHTYGKRLYIGHSLYKVGTEKDPNWMLPDQIPAQVRLLRRTKDVQGSGWYSANWFAKNPLGFADSLKNTYYRYPVLQPPLTRLDAEPPLPPVSFDGDSEKEGILLTWLSPGDTDAHYWVVYRKQGKEAPTGMPEERIGLVPAGERSFLDKTSRFGRKYTYLITGVDRAHNESEIPVVASQRRWSGLFRKK